MRDVPTSRNDDLTGRDPSPLNREHVLSHTFAHDTNRRSWLRIAIAAFLAHIVLIAVLVYVTRSRQSADAVRDVPVMRGMLADTAASGTGPVPGASPLDVFCRYVVDGTGIARLQAGPPRSPGRLGCKSTLSLAFVPDWRGDIKARYNSDGQLAEIYDRVTVQGDSIVEMVQSWDLATPRPGRQWPGLPTFRLSVE